VRRVQILIASALAALALSVVGGAADAPASPAKASYWRDCGERIVGEALIVETKAHAVSCKIARRIAKRYAYKQDRHPLGFNCTEPKPTDSSGETSTGVCRREGARVRVIFGI
jgi:hypothetical protein